MGREAERIQETLCNREGRRTFKNHRVILGFFSQDSQNLPVVTLETVASKKRNLQFLDTQGSIASVVPLAKFCVVQLQY